MTQKYYSIMTTQGIEYINSQVLINPNKIMADGWYIKLGNGETEPSADMTDLSDVIYTKTADDYPQITFGSNNEGHYAQMLLPESLSGEIITEAGLFNQDDVLIAVAKTHIDLTESGDGLEMSVKQRIYLSAVPASVSVIYTSQADLVTEDFLNYRLDELADNIDSIKQDKLTAGANIYIDNNSVISAGGKYPYSFTCGNINSDGDSDLISYSGATVSYKVGANYPALTGVLPNGEVFRIDNLETDNVSALADGTYKKFAGKDGAELLNNTVTLAKTAPTSPSNNDVWIRPVPQPKYIQPNYTNNGITINQDGIAGGFSSSSMLFTNSLNFSQPFDLYVKFNKTQSGGANVIGTGGSNTVRCIALKIKDSQIELALSSNGTTYDILGYTDIAYTVSLNTDYILKLSFSGTQYILKISTDIETWTTIKTIDSTTCLYNAPLGIGGDKPDSSIYGPFKGSIDFKEFKLVVGGNVVYQPLIPSEWINSQIQPVTVKKYIEPYYRKNGTPTITANGIASGFSSTSFIKTPPVSFGNNYIIEGEADFNGEGVFLSLINANNKEIAFRNDIGANKIKIYESIGYASTDISYTGTLTHISYKLSVDITNNSYTFEYEFNNSGTPQTLNLTNSNIQTILGSLSYAVLGNSGVVWAAAWALNGSVDLKQFKIYVNDTLVCNPVFPNGWQPYNKIPLGKITVESGAVTGVKTYPFNKDYISNNIVKSYKNGNKGYQIHADGYCVQWGRENGANSGTVNLLPYSYADAGYNIQLTSRRENSDHDITAYVVGDRTASSFAWYGTATYTAGIDWLTTGYVEMF